MADSQTDKLFYQDSYIQSFEAVVLSCVPSGEEYEAVLDKTAFFPEGGGQYADTGYINEVYVSDVQEKNGVIYHKLDKALPPGISVSGKIGWEERFEKMQQHSAEHIVSGLVKRRFDYDNVGFHLGQDYCTLDFSGPISKDELMYLEEEANKAVWKNMNILISYPDKEELGKLKYRSKIDIEGQVRIVTIPDYDVCACCAPQVRRTGEIGLIKFVSMINYKGGSRITMLCGSRALRDYKAKQESIKSLGILLCEKEEHVSEAVERLRNDQSILKNKIMELTSKVLYYKAEELDITENPICVFDPDLTGNAAREFMNLVLKRGAGICAVFVPVSETEFRYVIGSRKEDVRPISRTLNDAFHGRGGGKADMVQGSLHGSEEEIKKIIGT